MGRHFSNSGAEAVAALARQVAELAHSRQPVLVAIDGRSGAGKSTLAGALGERLGATVIDGDDFFAGGVAVTGDPPEALAARCIDWRRQRAVLEALKAGRPASWQAFDWDAFDGSLATEATEADPAPVVILEGVYSGRPQLADLFDLRVLLRVPEAVRLARLTAREGEIGPWDRQWQAAERWYFAHEAPESGFDRVIDNG